MMKMMKTFNKTGYGMIVIAMVSMVACSGTAADAGGEQSESSASITGTISGAEGKQVYLDQLTTNQQNPAIPVDTATVGEDGSFTVETSPDYKTFYRLRIDQQNFLIFILGQGTHATVTANFPEMYKSYTVEGSKESQRLRELNRIVFPRDSLNAIAQNARMRGDQQGYMQAAMAMQTMMGTIDQEIKDFINRDPGSLSSLAALQNLDINNELEYYEQVIQALEGKVEGNPFYEQFSQELEKRKRLAPGNPAPEINLPQPSGELLALSSLQGKYVLIDFWASWCAPCRKENPNVKRVYDKYHDKGFEIYGVSLDKERGPWLKAIETDGLPWKHVSDLKFWNSSVVPLYNVSSIPKTFLVDPEGNIIARDLRGQELENKLAEVFSE